MGYSLHVFVSSTCYELRDLRAAIKAWLLDVGLTPMLSDDPAFPHFDGMPPYASCLRVIEECPLVIGVIDRQYGTAFQDWGPFPQHQGRSATHAELLHALDLGKRVLLYVHDDVWNFYEVWRKDNDAFETSAPRGLEKATLQLFHELKRRKPVPWMEHFADVTEVQQSLKREFVNQLYEYFRERQSQMEDTAEFFLKKIEEAAPEVRERVSAGLNPQLVADRELLRRQLETIEHEFKSVKATKEEMEKLSREKEEISARFAVVQQQLSNASLLVARAAMKDASWLSFVRTTMMPKQPGRVPFHNSLEVAVRGYNTAGGHGKPVLLKVTWSKVSYSENNLHRGYYAAIIFSGSGFVPGVTWTVRRAGETGPPTGHTDYFWRLPNIYFGDYLEVSTNDDEIESPLSWRNYEFQVKNPAGEKSDWVTFTYPFDEVMLAQMQKDLLQSGQDLLAEGKPGQAVGHLRKAYVFADRLLGTDHPDTRLARVLMEEANGAAALSKLRFRPGDSLTVKSGPHGGKVGVLAELRLNNLLAYLIKPDQGESFLASDEQVERTEVHSDASA